jgi:hypothetical protein
MRKNLVVCVCLFLLTVPIFGQNIDKTQYKAIDPFDYKLDEDKARRGTERKFKSVVEFVSEVKEAGRTPQYLFSSLDKITMLRLEPRQGMTPPSPGQAVTVYYTVRKTPTEDQRALDAFEDNRSKDEKALGVEKTPILPSTPNLNKRSYEEIKADEYRSDALYTTEDDEPRKFKVRLRFMSQDGILFKFSRPESNAEEPAFLPMKLKRRYPQFTAGQVMDVYFTAVKEFKDFVILDDIELVR